MKSHTPVRDEQARQNGGEQTVAQQLNSKETFVDHRPETAMQRRLDRMQNSSPPLLQQKALQDKIESSPLMAAQRQLGNETNRHAPQSRGHHTGNTVVQAKFKKDDPAASILKSLDTSQAPPIYHQLLDLLDKSDKEVKVELVSGGECANFNFTTTTLSLNAKSIQDAMAMATKKEAGWENLLNFMYATMSHELRHAYDHTVVGIPMLSGTMSELSQIWGLYKTELNAWQSEARAYLERGDTENPLVQGWVNFDLAHEDGSNQIWNRIIRYTNGAFQGRFPESWRDDTWNKRMRKRFMENEEILTHVTTLKTKFNERYESMKKK